MSECEKYQNANRLPSAKLAEASRPIEFERKRSGQTGADCAEYSHLGNSGKVREREIRSGYARCAMPDKDHGLSLCGDLPAVLNHACRGVFCPREGRRLP